MRHALLALLVLGCGGGGAGQDASPRDGGPGDARLVDAGPADGGGADGPATDAAVVDAGPAPDASACATPGVIPSLRAVRVTTDALTKPVLVAQPAGSADLYVVEEPGRIRIVRGGHVLPTPFLDVSAHVNFPFPSAEGGLVGLAFHPGYATNGRFFVFVTLKASGGKPDRVAIEEYRRSPGNPDVASAAPVAELLFAPHYGGNHVGGMIAFGPDGYLWAGVGDAAAEPSQAEDLSARVGKILRVDVDHPATPPPGALAGADPYVWDYGLRNPYRFAFDRVTGELFVGDAGDNLYDEVDVEAPGVGHHDYGWPRLQGTHCTSGAATCGPPGTPPAYERPHGAGYSVLIGGAVYRGAAIPCLQGRYLFAVFGTGQLLSFVAQGGAATAFADLSSMFADASVLMVTSISEDAAGELYLTTIEGNLYRIEPR